MNIYWIITAVILGFVILKTLTTPKIDSITKNELDTLLSDKKSKRQYVDVRTPAEFQMKKIKGFKNIPLGSLSHSLDMLNPSEPVILICASGSRSAKAAVILKRHGFTQVSHVHKGMS